MPTIECSEPTWKKPTLCIAIGITLCLLTMPAVGQNGGASTGTENGEWRHWGGDTASTRYSPLDQINAENFEDLEVAWVWRGDNYGPSVDNIMRSSPIYVDGVLYTVAGQRRTVVAVDPGTGTIRLIDYVAIEDVGRIVNPMTLHGQVVGAIVQGLGGTLLEHLVYDATGQQVRHLLDRSMASGRHEVVWDTTNDRGVAAASGLYFYRLQIGGRSSVRKMTLIR